jgi:hypothetical protein
MSEAVSEKGVPLDGKRAAETGWGERDNPFPKGRRDHEAWANAHKAQLGEMWKDWMHVPDALVEAVSRIDPATIDARVEEDRYLRAGRHLFDTAKSLGWKDDGEGAYEFIQRISYEQGLDDAKRGNRE